MRSAIEIICVAISPSQKFVEDERYSARVREGICPECGRNDFAPLAKMALLIRCQNCGAHFTTEKLF